MNTRFVILNDDDGDAHGDVESGLIGAQARSRDASPSGPVSRRPGGETAAAHAAAAAAAPSTVLRGGDDTGDGGEECRICSGAPDGEPLISPCACAGSIKQVHPSCLQHWIETRPHDDVLECELCNERYRVRFERKFVCDCKHSCSCVACGHAFEGCVLLFCLVCIVAMMWILPFDNENTSEETIILVLFGATVIFSLYVLYKVYRRWRDASSQVTLVGADSAPSDSHVLRESGLYTRYQSHAGAGGGAGDDDADLREFELQAASLASYSAPNAGLDEEGSVAYDVEAGSGGDSGDGGGAHEGHSDDGGGASAGSFV